MNVVKLKTIQIISKNKYLKNQMALVDRINYFYRDTKSDKKNLANNLFY